MELYYVFHSSGEPYSITTGNSPSLTVNGTKTYWANAAGNGGAATYTCSNGTVTCVNGTPGAAGTKSSQTSNTQNLDGLSSAGIKLMKILPALLGGYLISRWV
jgi:hypothetical protein